MVPQQLVGLHCLALVRHSDCGPPQPYSCNLHKGTIGTVLYKPISILRIVLNYLLFEFQLPESFDPYYPHSLFINRRGYGYSCPFRSLLHLFLTWGCSRPHRSLISRLTIFCSLCLFTPGLPLSDSRYAWKGSATANTCCSGRKL